MSDKTISTGKSRVNAEVDELSDPDVFTPVTGQTRERNPSELMCGFLHCYYKDIYGIRAVGQELRNTVV